MIISFLNDVDELLRLMSSKDNPIVGLTGKFIQKSVNTVVDSIYNVAAHSPVFSTSSISRGTRRYYDLALIVTWNVYWNTTAVVMRDSRRWLFTHVFLHMCHVWLYKMFCQKRQIKMWIESNPCPNVKGSLSRPFGHGWVSTFHKFHAYNQLSFLISDKL